jgi:hypothetical protein
MADATPATIEVVGVDGSHWHLSGPGYGAEGAELGTSPQGLWDAPVSTIWLTSAFQDGATFGGVNWLKREVVFGVNIFETATQSWEEVDSAWRKAWSYEADSQLIITTQYGARRLYLRMSQQPEIKMTQDSHIKRWGKVTMTCTAGKPWWVEDDVTATAVTTTNTTVSGSEILWLPVSNPTDRPLYLRWVGSAPATWTFPDFSWDGGADAARVVHMPSLTTGQDITVDTDPMEEMVVAADGSSVWARMNGVAFVHAVPPWTEETNIPVTVTGAPIGASVMVRCPRNWSRPWGLQ